MVNNYFFLALGIVICCQSATAPVNMFYPWDILLFQPLVTLPEFQCSAGYERLINSCGMQADDEELCQDWRKCVPILQMYQDEQNAVAALKGNDLASAMGQKTFLFAVDDDNGTHGLFKPCGKLTVDNILLSARYAWCNGITFGLYLPVLHAELKDVSWRERTLGTTFESQLNVSLISELERIGHLHLGGWKRWGLGDLAALFTWDRFYFQNKPWLKNVHAGLRGGLLLPTGLKRDEDRLFAFAFGNDGGLGVVGGATLELWLAHCLRLCLDGEFTQVFGTCRSRRIKTDRGQTDLLFLVKAPAYKEIGFQQHYTMWLEAHQFYKGLSLRVAYQYTKHNEDKLFIGSDHWDPVIANSAESLQEWTMHNLVITSKYEFWQGRCNPRYWPTLMVFYKHGFNGKRAVLANTVGVQLSVNF